MKQSNRRAAVGTVLLHLPSNFNVNYNFSSVTVSKLNKTEGQLNSNTSPTKVSEYSRYGFDIFFLVLGFEPEVA